MDRPPLPIIPTIEIRCSSCHKLVINDKPTCWCVPIHIGFMVFAAIMFVLELILVIVYKARS